MRGRRKAEEEGVDKGYNRGVELKRVVCGMRESVVEG